MAPGCAQRREPEAGVRMLRSALASRSRVGWDVKKDEQWADNPGEAPSQAMLRTCPIRGSWKNRGLYHACFRASLEMCGHSTKVIADTEFRWYTQIVTRV